MPDSGAVDHEPTTVQDVLLAVRGVSVRFGGVAALRQVDLDLTRGAVLGLVGPNGAGKTTLMNAISGLVRPTSGQIVFGDTGVDLCAVPASERMRLGISRTFQHSRLFSGMRVIDQLMCGAYVHTRYSFVGAIIRSRVAARVEEQVTGEARTLLDELGLLGVQYAEVGALPSPHRRLVDLGRALMSNPTVLLLDEIAAGMTDVEKQRVIEIVRRRNAAGLSVIVIEHDLAFVRALCEELAVMVQGSVLRHGRTDVVLDDPEVLRAYVGE